jgi:hypothetical protein
MSNGAYYDPYTGEYGEEFDEPFWEWSLGEGWEWGGVSAPAGPTTTGQGPYDPWQDPSIIQVLQSKGYRRVTPQTPVIPQSPAYSGQSFPPGSRAGVGLGAGATLPGTQVPIPAGSTMLPDIVHPQSPVGQMLGIQPGSELPEVQQAGLGALLPVAGAVAGGAVKWLATKGLLQTLVKSALAGGAASAAWGIIQNLFGLTPDQAVLKAFERKPRRYTIGSNPRVRTLQKVANHTQRLLKRHEKVIKKFIYKGTRRQIVPLAERYLSKAEKAAIKSGN